MDVWKFIQDKLSAAQQLMLLYVLESEGSSPGRNGFKMAVAADGSICGTIGGGIMEHKLVEKAKTMLQQNEMVVLLMRQYHDKVHTTDQSGMICSGRQVNVFIPLSSSDENIIKTIVQGGQYTIQLSPKGLTIQESVPKDQNFNLQFKSEEDWIYHEKLNQRPVIHIIGGGHVSLALSELMCFLGFYSKVYDDRPELNTILENYFTNEKIIVPGYEQLGAYIRDCKNEYAVIMTLGYRTDKIALLQLLNKEFNYLGLMGSDNKIETLFSELRSEGISEALLKKIFTPVGINIYSKTTPEIAVSIAAEIIREKNKNLPTGRQQI
jgi:xanthine dehydrogenase accessory factor